MPLKNDTYEYRKNVIRPRLRVNLLEIGLCEEKVLLEELKRPFNGRFYHTTDTNKFFFDYNDKRYELDLFGNGGGGTPIDLSEYAKKKDVPKKTSQLSNDSGFVTLVSLDEFLSDNGYVTAEGLLSCLADFVSKNEMEDIRSEIMNEVNELKEEIKFLIDASDSDFGITDMMNRLKRIEDFIENEYDSWDDFSRE